MALPWDKQVFPRLARGYLFNSFLRIQNTGSEQGYNTSSSSPAFDEKASFTDDLNWSSLELVSLSGVDHFAFFLDINEINNTANQTLALTDLQFYVSNTGGQNTSNVASLGELAWNLDVGPDGDSEILINYGLNPGSGVNDIAVYVPKSNFDAAYHNLTGGIADPFIYLYSAFDESDDGFEEWGIREASNTSPPPPPAAKRRSSTCSTSSILNS